MSSSATIIKEKLQKEIFRLQRNKYKATCLHGPGGLGPLLSAFPEKKFPTGVIHEFITGGKADIAATTGFISGILTGVNPIQPGPIFWISNSKTIFPPAFSRYGVNPSHIIFIYLKNEKEIHWVLEETMKCNGILAVIAELPDISFTLSRRLQLAVENSGVTGFLVRNNMNKLSANTCTSRWHISPAPSTLIEDLPGIGYTNWNVELLKIRNGKPGSWLIEWRYDKFGFPSSPPVYNTTVQLQTG